MSTRTHWRIVEHYEACLARHGDNHLGVDWPNAKDAALRYQVMLEVVRPQSGPHSLLDFGCGASHFLEYLRSEGRNDIEYMGLDASPKFVELSQRKYPEIRYQCLDVLEDCTELPDVDYVVMNGVFTEKRELSHAEMLHYFQQVLSTVFPKVRQGLAFNVMSKHVDWERDDLFHLPFDTLAAFLKQNLSRHFLFRNDYGLYEYTTYVYR